MTDHDALAALPLTREEEADVRAWWAGRPHTLSQYVLEQQITRLLATLDAERGVRETEGGRAGGASPDPATCEHDALIDGDNNCPDCGAPVIYRAAGVRVTGDAGLREAALDVLAYLDADPTQTVVPDGRIAALRAALATPEDPT